MLWIAAIQMGKPRGQRNAAKEKIWPGQEAALARELKRVQGDDIEPADEEPEYQGNDLPTLQPITAGILTAPRKAVLSDAPNCEVISAPPELDLAPAFPSSLRIHAHFSRRRRAKRLDFFREVKPAKRPTLPNKLPVWIGQDAPPNRQALGQMRAVAKKKRALALVKEMASMSKMDAFIKICRMGTRIEYALPELFYKGDPFRAFMFVESIDLAKFAIAVTA